MKILFVVVITATLLVVQQTVADVVVEGEGQYVVIGPEVLYSEHNYDVAVSVHNTKEPVDLEISIEGPTPIETQVIHLATPNGHKKIRLKIPKLAHGDYKLKVKGVKGLLFTHTENLATNDLNLRSFIQMDKKIYWPGETIYYRVVFMDKSLRPVQPNSNVTIVIEDTLQPVEVIKNFKVVNGVYTGKFKLYNTSFFGDYRISADYASPYEIGDVAYFTVIEPPTSFIEIDSVILGTGDVKVFVTSNLTSHPVNGKVDLSIESLKRNYVTNMINGTATLNLNLSREDRRREGKYSLAKVVVRDNATNNFLQGGTYLEINPNRYTFKCVKGFSCYDLQANKEYVVAFKITYKNGTSVTNTTSIVRAIYTENIIYLHELKAKRKGKTYTFETHLNEASIAEFKILLPELSVIKKAHHFYALEVEYDGEIKDIANLKSDTTQLFPNKTIPMEPSKDWFKITANQSVNDVGKLAIFTLNCSSPMQHIDYYIIGRGNIIESEVIQLSKPESIYNLSITVTDLMMPNSRLYVYFIDDNGKIHYAETVFKVNFELQNKIEIVVPEIVKPGSNVTFKIKTSPNSLVALTAVDQMVGPVINDIRTLELKGPNYLGKNSNIEILTNANEHIYRNSSSSDVDFDDDDYNDENEDNDDDEFINSLNFESSRDGLVLRKDESYDVEDTWIFDDINNTKSETFEWTSTVPAKGHSWLIKAFAVHAVKGLALLEKSITIKSQD